MPGLKAGGAEMMGCKKKSGWRRGREEEGQEERGKEGLSSGPAAGACYMYVPRSWAALAEDALGASLGGWGGRTQHEAGRQSHTTRRRGRDMKQASNHT